jgi:hypothetical protein
VVGPVANAQSLVREGSLWIGLAADLRRHHRRRSTVWGARDSGAQDVRLAGPASSDFRSRPTSKNGLILGLRLDGRRRRGRLGPSTIHETMRLQIVFTALGDVDAEVEDWLRQAYEENA